MISRWAFLGTLAAGLLAAPLAAWGQQAPKVWRIGFLYFASRQSALETGRYNAFLGGMRELGYVEGKNFLVEARFADGDTERLPSLAAELVRLNVDVIAATGTAAIRAAQQATTAIPIVMAVSADPVADGFAASLARPGRNITGLSNSYTDLSQKYLELLSTAVPRLSRVAVLMNPGNPSHPGQLKLIQAAATKARLRVLTVDGRTAEAIERAFDAMTRERVEAVIVSGDTFFTQQARQIADLALKYRLPSMYVGRDYPETGGLMSYGPNVRDNFRHAASFVDKILKGAKPGDLPIEQPTTFELVINLKTAKALGLTIPQSLVLRADELIQ